MECEIERDRNSPGCYCVVTAGEITLDVTVHTWPHQPDLKRWLHRVRRTYDKMNKKKCKILVGINARNSHNTVGSRGARKDLHHELLQICVGQHCLLIQIAPYNTAPMSLKTFFRRFFQDQRFVFMGVGIKDIAKKLHREYKDTNFKDMSIIPNPVDLREVAARQFEFIDGSKCSLENLAKFVLGVDYVKPKKMVWYCGDRPLEFSDELIKWSSVDVYLMAKIGMKLS